MNYSTKLIIIRLRLRLRLRLHKAGADLQIGAPFCT